MSKAFIGFDYSLKLPAMCICVLENNEFRFENCTFSYSMGEQKSIKKWVGVRENKYFGYAGLDNKHPNMDRYLAVSDAFLCDIDGLSDDNNIDEFEFAVEDYAFSQSGQLATLGEHTGVLKYKVWLDYGKPIKPYAPTTIKAFARSFLPVDEQTITNEKGKVNKVKMTKEMMHNAFKAQTGTNLCKIFGVDTVLTCGGSVVRNNPIPDIVDSYFITLYHYTQLNK